MAGHLTSPIPPPKPGRGPIIRTWQAKTGLGLNRLGAALVCEFDLGESAAVPGKWVVIELRRDEP